MSSKYIKVYCNNVHVRTCGGGFQVSKILKKFNQYTSIKTVEYYISQLPSSFTDQPAPYYEFTFYIYRKSKNGRKRLLRKELSQFILVQVNNSYKQYMLMAREVLEMPTTMKLINDLFEKLKVEIMQNGSPSYIIQPQDERM